MVGSEVCADEQVMCGNWDDLIWEGKNVAGGPATPEENGEHNKHNHDEDSSSPSPPIIIPIPIPIAIPWGNENENENENATSSSSSSLETTKETLFDSFAPASDKLLLAPHHRKYREESRNHVVRRLDFFTKDDLSNVEVMVDEEEQEQERLFEIVYGTIMDAIMAEAGNGNGNGNSSGSPPIPGTPKTAPLLNGIAHTCPPPPIKSSASNNHNMRVFIDKEICKKLHF